MCPDLRSVEAFDHDFFDLLGTDRAAFTTLLPRLQRDRPEAERSEETHSVTVA